MKPISLFLIGLLLAQVVVSQDLPPIGQWRDHLPMAGVSGILRRENKLLAYTRSGYFTTDASGNEINTYTRSNGLSGVNLRSLSVEPSGNGIAIAYESSQIDLITGDRTRSIPDIALNRTEFEKRINHINWIGNEAFLSSDFGIVVLNVVKAEVAETFRLGDGAASIQVRQVALAGDTLYAATAAGLKKSPFVATRMRDYRSWQLESIGEANLPANGIIKWEDRLAAWRNDSVFVRTAGLWKYLPSGSGKVSFVSVDGGKLAVGRINSGSGVVFLIDLSGNTIKEVRSKWLVKPSGFVQWNGVEWLADSTNGLIRKEGDVEKIVLPQSPLSIPQGSGTTVGSEVWISGGYVQPDGTASRLPGWLTRFDGNGWQNWSKQRSIVFDSLPDLQSIAADPVEGGLWVGSYGGGLLYISKEGKLKRHLQPLLGEDQSEAGSIKVGGIAYDRDMNLWITNPGAQQPIVLRKPDGSRIGFNSQLAIVKNRINGICIDLENRKWLIAPDQGLICWDDGATPDRIADDRWRLFRQGRGNGNLPSGKVLAVAADKNGLVWVGTERGIAVIQCGEDLFSASACDAVLPVVQQGSYAGLLLSEETIYDIKIDPANRKWIATANGVWLLSEDGQKVIFRFTSSNSPLLDNKVYAIVPENRNGEIFFLTASGLCSFRSTATNPVEETKPLFVFPNPVPSGFTGTIGIRGLPEEAWVKITTHDGKLVYQTRSLGGQATWNGKDLQGSRLNSGVYLILASDRTNRTVASGKIFLIK